ncbi:hypothetical protein ACIBH1_06795 [Nonomuraea sp. NPDC050663]|uniref:hypothetical protein n=1 Tax=Nonomuraea sp. NPDC050663 TaxID=3364370 RepID=UPI0037B1AAF6
MPGPLHSWRRLSPISQRTSAGVVVAVTVIPGAEALALCAVHGEVVQSQVGRRVSCKSVVLGEEAMTGLGRTRLSRAMYATVSGSIGAPPLPSPTGTVSKMMLPLASRQVLVAVPGADPPL